MSRRLIKGRLIEISALALFLPQSGAQKMGAGGGATSKTEPERILHPGRWTR